MVVNLTDWHWSPAITTNETITDLILQVEILEIMSVVQIEVYVEPTHIVITIVYSQHFPEIIKEKIASKLRVVCFSADNTKNYKAYEVTHKIIGSDRSIYVGETETDYERFECYFSLPVIIQTEGIKTELIDSFLTITMAKVQENLQVAKVTNNQPPELELDLYESPKLHW